MTIKHLSKFSKKELDSIFKSAKRVHRSQAFTILSHPSSDDHGKILPIVSKKYGNAPARNLIKRRLKEIFRQESLFKKKIHLIVIIRPEAKKLSFSHIKEIILHALA